MSARIQTALTSAGIPSVTFKRDPAATTSTGQAVGAPAGYLLPGTPTDSAEVMDWESAAVWVIHQWGAGRSSSLLKPFWKDRDFWLATIAAGGPLGLFLTTLMLAGDVFGPPYDQIVGGLCATVSSGAALVYRFARTDQKVKAAYNQGLMLPSPTQESDGPKALK